MEIKEVIEKSGINLAKGFLPMPIVAIIDAINECESEDELKLKYNELKQYVKEYAKVLPNIPMSVEVEYASVVALYYLIEPHNINILLNTKQLQEEIELILEEQMEDIEEFEVRSDYIILQSPDQISKREWQDGAIQTLREILDEEFNIKIKSILYA
ncbi:hypothetical protein FDB15_14055 [Clostridium botulinum]|uniref:hypothetical protein n=1 Tax=unclassified Clostridium TaxID=2614128 RepID=UPI00050738B7|nr:MULTISPECIES: hypothetical protein [unclassified Clostridium]AIY78950.1 hypothetical protein U728_1535 [Clostridium botulinum 202F]KAI3346707.1 hypothetical protein CIT17_06990 [Clostridium botulinum]KFX53773.1 hypothetical protein KU40_17545 [Clostridium botulinum]KON13939.1 hypothetical protein ACP50_07720 [Clostridium botulinum]MBY6780048.1 hypothetical protein [Clostridium botulinum]